MFCFETAYDNWFSGCFANVKNVKLAKIDLYVKKLFKMPKI